MTTKTDIAELTSEKLEEIRQRYRQTEVPKCHICGAEMTIQRMSASSITYGCAGAIYDETGGHYAEGRSLADDHYAESRITVVDVSDHDVLALVEALEARDKQIANDVQIKARLCRESNSLHDRLREAEKRIAELESRTVTVKLPKLKMLEDYLAEVAIEERKAILNGVRIEFHRVLTAAGIKWEAE
ncbi:ead/Ea22-like family protein [Klebsiella michiganensis]|uniref:ead/Ea22-like family protein n=1 Tax=Klebsiella michiganensis TaxID=1134687 RepID=UPI001CCEE7A4|nr:ead/Ea22-like family protein [Klebsiella michiganensis]MBZ7765337.1 ead/Ea22-like family protein [Klebsiella michiganensis]